MNSKIHFWGKHDEFDFLAPFHRTVPVHSDSAPGPMRQPRTGLHHRLRIIMLERGGTETEHTSRCRFCFHHLIGLTLLSRHPAA